MTTLEATEGEASLRELVAELLRKTPSAGPNECEWPGLTAYRFDRPQPAQWAEVRSLALCFVVQGRKRFMVEDRQYLCDPHNYMVFTRGMRFQAEILEASDESPYLSFVLQLDTSVVRSVASEIAEARTTPFTRPSARSTTTPSAHLSSVDSTLMDAVLRFLQAVSAGPDLRVLAPLYQREITYRLMQAEQVSRLFHAATTDCDRNPVAEVIKYAREHISEPLKVAELAQHAKMSPSALSTLFADATGMGPYQFLKRMRLDAASSFLIEDNLTVSEVSRAVGYTSLSHFINEFKRHFGATPRAYAESQRQFVAMRVDAATSPRAAAH